MRSCCSFRATQFFIVLVSCLHYAIVTYHRVCPSILFDELAKTYGVQPSDIGVFGSMYFWPYALIQPFIGIITDIVEPAYIIAFSGFLSSLGSLIIGFTKCYELACFARVLVGLGCGPIMVPICKMFANWFSARGFFIFQGLVLASGAAGGVVAQAPLAKLIQSIDYKYSFIGVAAAGLFLSILTLFMRGQPYDMGFEKTADGFCITTSGNVENPLLYEEINKFNNTDSSVKPSAKSILQAKMLTLKSNVKKVLSNKYFWTLVIWDAMSPGTYYNFSSMWGDPYLQHVIHYDENKASFIVILLNVAWIAGTPILTFISEITKSRKWVVVINALSLCAICICMYFVTDQINDTVLYVLIFSFGFFGSAPCSIGVAMFKEMECPESQGTALGCSNLFPFLSSSIFEIITAAILKFVDGNIDKHTLKGYRYALWIPSIIASGLGFIGAIISIETYPKPEPEASFQTQPIIMFEDKK